MRRRDGSGGLLLGGQDVVNGFAIPAGAAARADTLGVQFRGDFLKGHSRGPEGCHAGDNRRFTRKRAIGLCAFTIAPLSLHAQPSAAQLQHDHGLVVFGDGAHDLTEQLARGIIRAKVWFGNRDQCNSAALEVLNDVLLHHEIPCQTVKFLDKDGFDAIPENAADHFNPRGPVHAFRGAGNAFLTVDLRNGESVAGCVAFDSFKLAGEAVTVNLALAGNPEIRESSFHASIMGAFRSNVKYFSLEIYSTMILNHLNETATSQHGSGGQLCRSGGFPMTHRQRRRAAGVTTPLPETAGAAQASPGANTEAF